METKIERLEKVLAEIDEKAHDEDFFVDLYSLLRNELKIEKEENQYGNYHNQLKQTMEKQAREYKYAKTKNPTKNCYIQYNDFRMNFRSDVFDEFYKLTSNNISKSPTK